MLIPDHIESFNSKGEQILYFKFKNDLQCNKFYILHSLFTNYHIKSSSGELDFLVLAPGLGFFALEVKHGSVRRENGTWYFGNGKDEKKTTKSPFMQVNMTMNSIRKYALEKIKDKTLRDRLRKVLFGSGVAFTGMDDFADLGPEGLSWQVLTRRGLAVPISVFIRNLSEGFHESHRSKAWYDVLYSRPTDQDCQNILQILRGDFDTDYTDLNKLVDHEFLIEEFTKEQFGLLDFLNYNKRMLVQGPAGTGKTLMALEIVRRMLHKGKSVAMICFNHQLGEHLKSLTIGLKCSGTLYCGTLHGLLQRYVLPKADADKDAYYFTETLPIEFILQDSNPEVNKYDFLVLDEAQDLLSAYYLEVFDMILNTGLKSGDWIFFGDFSNQAIYLDDPKRSINLLSERATFTLYPPLKVNCRNTRKIALQNTLMTGITRPEFNARSIDGDPIETCFVEQSEGRQRVEEVIKGLRANGIPAKSIAILSPKILERSYLNESTYLKRLASTEGLVISTIHAFKGLESSIIVLCDFDNLDLDDSKKLLYIGISRARLGLHIILDQSLKEQYSKVIATNYPLLN